MRIALVGGTGKEGRGLGSRWAAAGHDVVIGSRDSERAEARAREVQSESGRPVTGCANIEAVRDADLVVLCVPYGAHGATLETIAGHIGDAIVMDITVPLVPPKVRRVHLPEGEAAALETQAILGSDTRIVAALHHVSSAHLADPDHAIDCDVLVCGNDREARDTVIELMADLGMRGVDAGVLANAVALEALTPVLLHVNRRYGSPGAGIRITGI